MDIFRRRFLRFTLAVSSATFLADAAYAKAHRLPLLAPLENTSIPDHHDQTDTSAARRISEPEAVPLVGRWTSIRENLPGAGRVASRCLGKRARGVVRRA